MLRSQSGYGYDLIDADFFLEMGVDEWHDLVTNTKENDGADLRHTLNTLDLMIDGGISKNATGDQFRADIFFRVNRASNISLTVRPSWRRSSSP